MPVHHILLALLVVTIWGVNFLFVKIGLEEFPPFFLCACRFFLASVPVIFLIKPPKVPFRLVLAYGLVMFALQFSFFFLGMSVGMMPGMASLLMQVQVFFSMFFAAFILKEKPIPGQVLGALISFLGIAWVAGHIDNHSLSRLGLTLMLASAATWGVGNLITKKMPQVNMIALVVWGSLVACMPLTVMSLIFEGLPNIMQSWTQLTSKGLFALCYIAYCSTWIGYGVWNWLLTRYPISAIVPFTLLVPVVGMLSAVVFYHETMESWKIIAGILVISGVCINILSMRIFVARTSHRLTSQELA